MQNFIKNAIFSKSFCGIFNPIFNYNQYHQYFYLSRSKEKNQQESIIYASLLSHHINEAIAKYVSIVETVALDDSVISLDYTQAEPYMQSLIQLEGDSAWSHFVIANQYGTEQAHSEGDSAHGISLAREEAFERCKDAATSPGTPSLLNDRTPDSISNRICQRSLKCLAMTERVLGSFAVGAG